jgi:hypothetical protein
MKTSVIAAVVGVVALLAVAGLAIASSTGAGMYSSQTRSGDGSGMMGSGSGMMGDSSHMQGSGDHDSCPMDNDSNRTNSLRENGCPCMG